MSYEVLYSDSIDYIEPGDVIRFDWMDDDFNIYEETVQVRSVSSDMEKITVIGYSEVLNDVCEYDIDDDEVVEVLGG